MKTHWFWNITRRDYRRKRVLVGPDLVTVILNYRKAGRAVCEADKPWHCSHFEDFSKSQRALQTLEIRLPKTAASGVAKGRRPFSGWSHHGSRVEYFLIKLGPVARLNLWLTATENTLFRPSSAREIIGSATNDTEALAIFKLLLFLWCASNSKTPLSWCHFSERKLRSRMTL